MYSISLADVKGTINSEINGTPKGVYLPISKLLHSIFVVANLLAHNNLWLCYYEQVNSQRLKQNVASKWESKHLWGTIYFAVNKWYIDRNAVLLVTSFFR